MREFPELDLRLGELIDSRGLSAKDLAEKADIQPEALKRILTGRQINLSTRTIVKLSRYFDTPIQEFIDYLSGV